MYIKHGKPVFTYKDTFSLDETLSPIICEALKKFKKTLLERDAEGKCLGVPIDFYPEDKVEYSREDSEKAFTAWVDTLDKMIYAFDDNEPDIAEYDFEFITNNSEPDEKGLVTMNIHASNEDEYSRYKEDQKAHQEYVEEGLDLFAKFYQNLWW